MPVICLFDVFRVGNRHKICGFCINLGDNYSLQSLTICLIVSTLINIIKLQMCVFFRIFVCEAKEEKAPICRAQKYKEIWTYASNFLDKITVKRKMSCLAYQP